MGDDDVPDGLHDLGPVIGQLGQVLVDRPGCAPSHRGIVRSRRQPPQAERVQEVLRPTPAELDVTGAWIPAGVPARNVRSA